MKPHLRATARMIRAAGPCSVASGRLPPPGDHRSPAPPKRGVLLLIALVMLALFMLLGTSYILIANRRRPCTAAAGAIGSKIEDVANDTTTYGGQNTLTGQPDGGSHGGSVGVTVNDRVAKYFTNSLLADKYGDWYEQGTLASISPLGGSMKIPFFTISFNGPLTFGPDATIAAWSAANPGKTPDLGSQVGRILSIESEFEPNAVFRIVARQGSTFIAHLVNPYRDFDHRNLASGATLSIQGREFSGDNEDAFQLHENYDAPDNRNLFMAWVQTDAVLGRDQQPGTADDPADGHRYVIPSFHRPDKLLATIKTATSSPGAFYNEWLATPISLLRPAGKMSWDPSVDWTKYGLTGVPPLPGGNDIEHPNFTGGNIRTVGGSTGYFDPLHGPWDVDNDGDGITDSIWLDIGMPAVTIGNAQVQPLVAMMIVDLDGRVNLNAHGNDIAFQVDPTRPMLSGSWARYAGTVNPTESGTAGPKVASLPHAQGWGVADISPFHVFGTNIASTLLQGSQSTGSSTTSSGLIWPSIKAEGRFGDSADGVAALSPAPGLLGVADPGVDAAAVLPRDNHIPDRYSGLDSATDLARAVSTMSPVDTRGTMTIGLDQFGNPRMSRLRCSSFPSRFGPMGADPVPLWIRDRIDDPYDVSLGRRAPRPGWSFDPDVQTSPSTLQDNLFTAPQFERLLRMFEPGSEKLSPRLVSLLGPHADIARIATTIESWDTPAITIPREKLEPLLALSDQTDNTQASLVSWDLALGLRMNINRPFGDGIDNDLDGIADEPGEYEAEIAANVFGMNGTDFANQCLTNGRDVNGDGDVDFEDQKRVRELFARHLYVLVRTMAPAVSAREAAQWAVNVVDMRDPDSIITRFAFDERIPAPGQQWTANDLSNVVWGCERPELLITEAMAWRNIRSGTNAVTGQTEYTDKGTGGLVIEFFNPWVGMTENGFLAGGVPYEFLPTEYSWETRPFLWTYSGMDLAKVNSNGDPVFQIAAVYETGTGGTSTLAKLAANAAWPQLSGTSAAASTINGLVIYPAKVNEAAIKVTGTLGTFVSRDGPSVDATTLKGGQFALVSGPVVSGSSTTLANTIDTSATGTASMTFNYSTFSDAAAAQVLQFTGGITETITGSNGYVPAGRSSASYFLSGSNSGAVGALVCVENPSGGAAALRFPVLSGTMTLPELTSAMAGQKYRLLLRRLANPLEPHNGSLNPYICIDSMVVQDQAVAAGDPGTAPPLRSAERCAAQPADKSVNNLWRHASDDDAANVDVLTAPLRGAVSAVNASLGFLPARLKIPSGEDKLSETEQPVFPWLTWLNREFVSEQELLLVARSSPATLLRDHTHDWPFKHLFFQLGSGTSNPEKDLEQNKIGILELLRVPSRFADAETPLPATNAIALSSALVGLGGKPLFLPPHNYLSHFREPGRVNLNTMSSRAVWVAMNGGRPGAPYEDEVAYSSDGTAATFQKSEDWLLMSGSGSSPLAGNWQVNNPDEDANGNNRLDVNHDENNDGKRQVSKAGVLQSISASRRGWPLSADGSTPAIAGQFDRVLNRKGVAGDRLWFSNPFQSGWGTGLSTYGPDQSLMLRHWMAKGSGSSFLFGFKHVNEPDADKYLIDSTGMRRFSEWNSPPTTYWGASANGVEGRLIYKFDFGNPTSAIRLNASLPAWDFGGGNRGASSLEVSKDGSNWVSIHNNLEPRKWGEPWSINDALPAEVVGSDSLYIRMRFYTEGAPIPSYTVAQFGRSTSAASANVFEVKADLVTDGQTGQIGPAYLMATNLGLKDSKGNDQDGRPYADPRRNPYFRYREMMRLSNLSTSRSNVFAVWMTVGFFVIEPHPTRAGDTALGAEYGLETGDAARFKSFMIIDRSLPVGFRPGVQLNSRDSVLLDHFGN
jgi:hypothetical protein